EVVVDGICEKDSMGSATSSPFTLMPILRRKHATSSRRIDLAFASPVSTPPFTATTLPLLPFASSEGLLMLPNKARFAESPVFPLEDARAAVFASTPFTSAWLAAEA
ncbi:unnamed protein product, partial [Ectocarpus sp. 12 AP-2014]